MIRDLVGAEVALALEERAQEPPLASVHEALLLLDALVELLVGDEAVAHGDRAEQGREAPRLGDALGHVPGLRRGLEELLLPEELSRVHLEEERRHLGVVLARELAGAHEEVAERVHEAPPALDQERLLDALEGHEAVLARELSVEELLVDRLGAGAHAVRPREPLHVDHVLVLEHLLEGDAEGQVDRVGAEPDRLLELGLARRRRARGARGRRRAPSGESRARPVRRTSAGRACRRSLCPRRGRAGRSTLGGGAPFASRLDRVALLGEGESRRELDRVTTPSPVRALVFAIRFSPTISVTALSVLEPSFPWRRSCFPSWTRTAALSSVAPATAERVVEAAQAGERLLELLVARVGDEDDPVDPGEVHAPRELVARRAREREELDLELGVRPLELPHVEGEIVVEERRRRRAS